MIMIISLFQKKSNSVGIIKEKKGHIVAVITDTSWLCAFCFFLLMPKGIHAVKLQSPHGETAGDTGLSPDIPCKFVAYPDLTLSQPVYLTGITNFNPFNEI